ncbi:MAG: CvpA family protein [Bacteroidia bacterium]|nr:CvpA family protein [Bacteroidia bacterium]
MNFIDLVLIIPILWFGYKGFTKGFIIEIASLAALMLGLYGGIIFSGFVAGYISKWFEIKSDYVPLISFSVTFLIIVIIVFLVAKGVDKLVKSAALGIPNKLAGAVVGAAKTIVIISVLLLLVNKYDKNGLFLKENIRNNSLLYNPLSELVVKVYPSVTETLGNVLESEKKPEKKDELK